MIHVNQWIDDVLPLRVLTKTLPASSYNRIRLGLLRLGQPLRIAIDAQRQVDCILDHYAWICVDAKRNDNPLLAWTSFILAGRKGLHLPVECELRLFHRSAGIMMATALRQLEQSVDALRASHHV